MKELYKRFLSTIVLLGTVLVILQFVFVFVSTFLSLDKMISSTATSLLASTNAEIKENVNQHFNRMIRVANQIASDDTFISYSRTESKLTRDAQAETELTLGRLLAGYSALDDFCDCAIVYSDGTFLGQVDAVTAKNYPDKTLYETFSHASERDSQNFLTAHGMDYSRIYYSKMVNPTTIAVISILRENLEPVFYDAEENFNLTLHMSTPEHHVIYSGDENEMVNGTLSEDLAQAVENSSHLSIELKGTVIASDTCVNGWRITSTIPENTLTSDNRGLRIIYLIISAVIIILAIVLITILCINVKKRLDEFARIEENLDDYADIKDINLNG